MQHAPVWNKMGKPQKKLKNTKAVSASYVFFCGEKKCTTHKVFLTI